MVRCVHSYGTPLACSLIDLPWNSIGLASFKRHRTPSKDSGTHPLPLPFPTYTSRRIQDGREDVPSHIREHHRVGSHWCSRERCVSTTLHCFMLCNSRLHLRRFYGAAFVRVTSERSQRSSADVRTFRSLPCNTPDAMPGRTPYTSSS